MGRAEKVVHPEPDHIPTADELKKADKASIYDAEGKYVKFGTLRSEMAPFLAVFVRHWGCSSCMQYVEALIAEPQLADVRIMIIGHGAASGINQYRKATNAPPAFEIYADPEKELFGALGVTRSSLDLGPVPNYQRGSDFSVLLRAVRSMLSSGTGMFKGGSFSQLGAEFYFDAQGSVTFAHRMRNTRDHTEVPQLVQAIKPSIEA
ncbi:L-rhamnose-1-dehydrogenase [Tilletia horrida]|uniref:L-rhamnose-1-dehydrogenase n=1 Tax=Tilletia horrida TaxID=155126 RepID=A0AAN6JSY5_9BASI|nr:L-rhamnose-1-dehydrogenase [Tilletia horrida]KAK0553612.1 L-rhamnose-1-dehydrogenase [Tilletia horrida]KAK0567538.1 L-rhamnose-1-dehydrogenase [Tilletia horrida]